jgi:methylthioribose-1-phosphate isomerase
VAWIAGRTAAGDITRVRITPETSNVRNEGFDVTPARLVTAIITERGVAPPDGLQRLYPERQ